jgi:hypothetical protein
MAKCNYNGEIAQKGEIKNKKLENEVNLHGFHRQK